jgi:choline dehydrogenase-like flavoprotein
VRYTYIIVGAGSAGCVLANRLSENPDHSVLLIEAGSEDTNPLIRIPMGVGKTLADPKLNWYYMTEPEPGNAHRPRVWLRGKTLGGSSAINGMMYMRGQPQDYDHWEDLGNAGWGWRDMGRCFREIEDHELGDDGVRGVGGPVHISIQRHRSKLTEAVLNAGVALGLARKEDINRPEQEGIGYTPVTIRNGRRVSAADAFLRPARGRPNLHVVTDTVVNRILFDGSRADGVEAVTDGKTVRYTAAETILAAGALQSPKLLQLSGVGPPEHLASLGIPVVADRPGVGANLREHKVLTMQLRLRGPYSHNAQLQGARLYWNLLRYWASRGGPLASTYDITAFVRTAPNLSRPDAQLTFWSLTLDKAAQGMKLESKPGMLIMGYPLRTESEGSVRLRSADPADPPILRTNFLASNYDRQVIVGMFRLMRKFVQQPALQALIESETFPGSSVQSDADILEACRQDDTCMHAIGTCRMGQDSGAVVDADLRVHGVQGLRVVDCSVMPTQVSGNTNGPVMALAWRAAERILAQRIVE